MKLRCPLDTYQYISQTYAEHVARAYANGWAPYPTGVSGTVYYYGGIDYAVYNIACKAAADGVVSLVDISTIGYGKSVRIDHGNGYVTIYAHLSSIQVVKGQIAKAGDIIGVTGNTGNSTGPHLHFELRLNGSPIDPQPMIDDDESEDNMKGTILVNGLAVRSQPAVNGTVLKRVGTNSAPLDVDSIDTVWIKLKNGNYVCAKYKGEDYIKLEE
jgi:hypothetical protein